MCKYTFTMPTVLAILPEGFEEIETITPVDLLRRAGVEVTVAALGETIHVTGRNRITLHADTPLGALDPDAPFDLLFLPGGPGVKHLRADPRVRRRALAQAAGPGWLAAICAAPTVLHDAGLLAGRRYTAHFSVADELPDLLAAEPVVVDGRLITSRGAGTALPFGLKLVEVLTSPEKAREIAASICTS
jgi:4-methyl-5(b-hydroxyethyl)-thiazole monophosphate biosynthesis